MRYLLLLLLLSGCASRSTVPEIKRAPPSECLTVCPPIPKPASNDPNVIFQHHIQTIIDAGECRRMHEACVNYLKVPEPKPVEKKWYQR